MPITSNNGVWTNLVLKINATPSQKQGKSLLRFRIRYLRFSRSTASKKECPPNLWKVKSLRISCQNDMSRLCNHHKPTNRWKSISLYRDTNTHAHTLTNSHTHTHHWFGFLGRRSHLKVILFRPYRLSEAVGYRYLVPDTSCPIWNERDFTSVNLVFTARIFDFSERESVMNVYFKSVGTKNPWSKMLFFEHSFST